MCCDAPQACISQISIGGKDHVAKRFFKLGEVLDITPSINADELKAELGRLALLKWFLDAFRTHAVKMRVEVANSESV